MGKRWAFNASGFNQFGLYHDDCLYENDDVKEALTRLPAHLLDERAFRLQRAMQCSVQKTVLPKDQWPTYEEDREKGRYLTALLERSSGRGRSRRTGPSRPRQMPSLCIVVTCRIHYEIYLNKDDVLKKRQKDKKRKRQKDKKTK